MLKKGLKHVSGEAITMNGSRIHTKVNVEGGGGWKTFVSLHNVDFYIFESYITTKEKEVILYTVGLEYQTRSDFGWLMVFRF